MVEGVQNTDYYIKFYGDGEIKQPSTPLIRPNSGSWKPGQIVR